MALLNVLSSIDSFLIRCIELLAVPATFLFFSVAVLLTVKTRFVQFRAFPRFLQLLSLGFKQRGESDPEESNVINPFHALSTAMATTIGMGNIVGPSVAIMAGGPGALFWLVVYIFFGSVTKFAEVTFALYTRIQSPKGEIIGGPMQYLKHISTFFAVWYTGVMVLLFLAWSSLQSQTLAGVFEEEQIPAWIIGSLLALIVFVVLEGGARRVGSVASRLVPIMFICYVFFSLFILLSDLSALSKAVSLVMHSVFATAAPVGGFVGATVYQAMHLGIYRGIFISEAGLGTSSISHALADTKRPVDQGILALYSMASDALLSTLSGLIVLVTGVWKYGPLRNTLIYDAFKMHSPVLGRYVLIFTISLFVLTTVIGNSFNGMQSFCSLSNHRWIFVYKFFTIAAIFSGALLPVGLLWNLIDVMLTFAVVPNVIGVTLLAFRHPNILKINKGS